MISVLIWATIIGYILYCIFNFYIGLRNLPAGPIPLPIVGNLLLLDDKRPDLTLNKICDSYGGICTFDFGQRMVVITDPDLLKEALTRNSEALAGRCDNFMSILLTYMKNYGMGNYGIIFSNGQMWRNSRRLTLRILRDFGVGRLMMESKIHIQCNWLIECFDANVNVNYNPRDDIFRAVGSIIVDVLVGYDFRERKDVFYQLRSSIDNLMHAAASLQARLLDKFPILSNTPIFDFFKYKEITTNIDVLHQFFWHLTEETKMHVDYEQEPQNFIEAFLKHRKKSGSHEEEWSDRQLNCVLVDLLMAGMETTTTTIRWLLLYLIKYPQHQIKCREEIERVIGRRTVTMADKNNLPYTAAVIAETQRLSNIVAINVVHETTMDVTIGTHRLPKGTAVLPQIGAVLRNANIFTDPDEFKPDRFIKFDFSNKMTLDKNMLENVIPFSLGKRICLGEALAKMQLFLIVSSLIQRFTFETTSDNPDPNIADALFMGTLQPLHYELIVKPVF